MVVMQRLLAIVGSSIAAIAIGIAIVAMILFLIKTREWKDK
jgi:hypothetical protein